ncbi:GntR family transcriptional regulator [Fusobacterium sp.]|uniref:FadR/GntR family transcriptional regulator n=1 Tax=Fusobacterium sp. TaxID=68766 RepID=UPI0026354550|nr:GntR family transcriptional regulator [Fusobacterium sp.]
MQKKSYLKVSDYIGEKISNGELKLGDRLPPERELAKNLDISRNSIREGLRILENIGVVKSQHGAGNFISAEFEETIADVMSYMFILKGMDDKKITEFRYAIEWEAVNLITGKLSTKSKEELVYYLNKLEESECEKEAVIYDKKIHYLLVELTNNDYMKTSYQALTKIMNLYIPRLRGKIILGMKGDKALSGAHRMIVEGVIEGDLKKSIEGLNHHFEYIMKYQDN